ncbi:MAG: endonuclease III [Prevotellaceae bacterium]|jgi:endonuclease-3|nr:endonuclease III [Prevotellaceae bacterium]
MTKKERYEKVLAWFAENMPEAVSELRYGNPYELLVAVILSAQCTDKRVNMLTPSFFKRFPTPHALAAADTAEIFDYIRSVSYPNNKAKHLHGMAVMLASDFEGKVPADVDTLQLLPGVGRKTANVIASVIYNRPVIAVDTHVFRVANRIGLADAVTPLETEKQLTRYIPARLRPIAHHWLILHGRYVCIARKPFCDTCGLQRCCRYYALL